MTAILRRKYTISTHTPLTGRDETGTDTAWKPLYFYSHAPYGTWPLTRSLFCFLLDFYSHAPYGTWLNPVFENATGRNFYSHAPYGTWPEQTPVPRPEHHFYSHAPYGTWQMYDSGRSEIKIFLLTRPLRDVTNEGKWCEISNVISTHTPLTGRDLSWLAFLILFGISTHTPLTGRDHFGNWSV